MDRIQRVGITGANGSIGRVLMAGLADRYELKAFSRREVDFPTTLVHFDQPAQVEGDATEIEALTRDRGERAAAGQSPCL